MTIHEAFQIALQHHHAGRFAEAEMLYRQILAVAPDQPDVQHLLGVIAHQVGRPDLAVEMIGRAIAMHPTEGVYHSNLGEAYRVLGRIDDAVASYRRAIQLKPDHAEAYGNLGNVLADLCRPDEAVEACRRAIQLKPDFVEGHYNLGNALKLRGDLAAAEAAYRRTLALRPDYWKAHTNLGAVLKDQRRPGEAIAQYRRALEINPDDSAVWNNLGTAWIDRGEFAEAVAAYRKAIELQPDEAEIHGNLLLALHYAPDMGPEEIFREHCRWGELHSAPLARAVAPHPNPADPERPLRIGYVSPDFREHSVAFFAEGLLACLDRSRFEPVCYSNLLVEDEVTARLRGMVPAWRGILDKKDAEVAELIRRDGIDILVDLAGHTGLNRLGVFARRPAPVQVTWLGYCDTTGMKEIDYRFTDGHADPPGTTEQWHTETLVRLPETFACFRPWESSPPVGPLPAAARGCITFGGFHMLAKLNEPHLARWAEIMNAVPGSRLLMVATALDEQETRQRFLATFARRGIEASRIEFRGRQSLKDYLTLHHEVDMMLDCHPFSGHTVSCHALWMGVPVVTLAGRTHCSRMVMSVLMNLGLGDLVAQSPEEYVKIASELASDLPRLGELRGGLRERMRNSPLLDAARFARNVEAAYREIWRAWCRKREGAP